MKKTVRVITEKEYEIEINDEILTQEAMNAFEGFMWELDGDTLDEKTAELFKFAARMLADGEEQFIEGLGHVASVFTIMFKQDDGKNINVVWNNTFEDVEMEIVA